MHTPHTQTHRDTQTHGETQRTHRHRDTHIETHRHTEGHTEGDTGAHIRHTQRDTQRETQVHTSDTHRGIHRGRHRCTHQAHTETHTQAHRRTHHPAGARLPADCRPTALGTREWEVMGVRWPRDVSTSSCGLWEERTPWRRHAWPQWPLCASPAFPFVILLTEGGALSTSLGPGVPRSGGL